MKSITEKAFKELKFLLFKTKQNIPLQKELLISQLIFQHILNIKEHPEVDYKLRQLIQTRIDSFNICGGKKYLYQIKELVNIPSPSLDKLQGIYYLNRYKAGSKLLTFDSLNTYLSNVIDYYNTFKQGYLAN